MNDVDESLKLMNFSYRSLKKNSTNQKEQKRAKNDEVRDDYYTMVMDAVRKIIKTRQQSED